MKMILRWIPGGASLEHIRQVPCALGIATQLSDIPAGQIWPLSRLRALRADIRAAGLSLEVADSVPVHEDIKRGQPARDVYIENFIQTIENLAAVGVKCLCYSFMPAMGWARSDFSLTLPDGSRAMAYRHAEIERMAPDALGDAMLCAPDGFTPPGWDKERIGVMLRDLEFYRIITREQYLSHAKYFLNAVVPVAAQCGVRLAIHPDDPPWPLFNLPRLITGAESIRAFLALHNSPYNGLTLCTGSLGINPKNDVPAIGAQFAALGRVPIVHARNIKRLAGKDFDECAHPSASGSLDMAAILAALAGAGFDGYIRPDRGRLIWDEQPNTGFGLYDRALGAMYLYGIWEALVKR